MSKHTRFRTKAPLLVKLGYQMIRESCPGLGEYKVFCPKCDYAAITSTSVRRCPYCGQQFCPPEQARTFV